MTDWIKGRELLEAPYRLTRRDIFNAVIDGSLDPHDKEGRRVFPNDELDKKYERLLALRIDLDEAKERFLKIYEERIADRKLELDHGFVGNRAPDIKTYIEIELPRLRQEESQILQERPAQIEKLENELAWAWKDLDLSPKQHEALMERLLDVWYLKDEVELFLEAKSQKQSVAATKSSDLTVPPGTQWKDIEITLVSDDTVRIKTPDWERRLTYHQLGFADKRKADEPIKPWRLLKIIAQNNGIISRENLKYDPTIPDTAKRLNTHLKKLFGIDDSIYLGHYKREKGYKTKIRFTNRTCTQPYEDEVIEGPDEIKGIFDQAQDFRPAHTEKKSHAE